MVIVWPEVLIMPQLSTLANIQLIPNLWSNKNAYSIRINVLANIAISIVCHLVLV